MMGSLRRNRAALVALLCGGGVLFGGGAAFAWSPYQQAGAEAAAQAGKSGAVAAEKEARPGESELYFPGGEAAGPFIPLRPATVEDRRNTEAARLYSAARGLEDQHLWEDAAVLFKEALKLDPDSVAIARRLCRVYLGPLNRPDLAIEYGKKALASDPNDTETLIRLLDFEEHKDVAAAESLLKELLANPKLTADSPGRILAHVELGKLYSGKLRRLDKAADSYAEVVRELDDRAANRLPPALLNRILGRRPELAYLNFGFIFLAAGRLELAAKAFERGLVYDEDNPQIAMLLADTLLKLNRPEEALAQVERSIRRQPQGVEAYELMARILTRLKREQEITPRLEEAARRDSKNIPLQYALADRYRETGQIEKADALYKELLRTQPTPQTYRALASSLLKRRKAAELLKLFCEALKRTGGPEAESISSVLQQVAADDAFAEEMLDAGFQILSSNPASLPDSAVQILAFLATSRNDSPARLKRLERLLKVQRLLLEAHPSALVYNEIADTERRLGRFAAAARTIEELIARYPAEKNARTLAFLADFHRRADHAEALRQTLDEALKLDPGDGDTQVKLAFMLADLGRVDECVRILQAAARREPDNPVYDILQAGILTRFDRHREAITLLENLLKRFGQNEVTVIEVRSTLSLVYVNMGDYAKGEAELEAVLEHTPDEAGPNNDLGYLYAEQGKNLDKAEMMIRKAVQKEPDNRSYLDSLAWVLFKRGKSKEALEPMIKAVARMREEAVRDGRNEDPTILEHLGDIYFKLEAIDKAAEAWREAYRAASRAVPPDKRIGEIKRKLDSLDRLSETIRPATSGSP